VADGVRAVPETATTRGITSDFAAAKVTSDGGDRVWRVDVPGVDEAISLVRRWVRLLLADDPELAEAFELIVSEYSTNALWHSASGRPGGRIEIELCVGPERVHLKVKDDGAAALNPDPSPDDVDEHGRGLVLASAYADAIGHRDTPAGLVAWALINR
jgi:anti-sigma regulatory factor (Ser/Thr protein kinase)